MIQSFLWHVIIRQPWAGLIAKGQKTTEIRTWRTSYRGRILIHAGLTVDPTAATAEAEDGALSVLGAIVASVSDYLPGLYAWMLTDVQPVDVPIPCRGRQAVWTREFELVP